MDFLYTLKGSTRRATRLVAVQILYQIHQTRMATSEALAQFEAQYRAFLEEQSDDEEGKSDSLKRASVPEINETGRNKHRRSHAPQIDVPFLKQLVLGAIAERGTEKELLQPHMKDGWTVERLPVVLLCILELALYELKNATAPAPIVINEAIELTKEFFDGEEPGFVNSLLDQIQKKGKLPGRS